MSKIPWEFSVPLTEGEQGSPNLPSPEGELLGHHLARLTLPLIERAQARFPGDSSLAPCSECAYVAGTVPNRSLATVGDALKCSVERTEFCCHKGQVNGEPRRLCAGWLATMLKEDA